MYKLKSLLILQNIVAALHIVTNVKYIYLIMRIVRLNKYG